MRSAKNQRRRRAERRLTVDYLAQKTYIMIHMII